MPVTRDELYDNSYDICDGGRGGLCKELSKPASRIEAVVPQTHVRIGTVLTRLELSFHRSCTHVDDSSLKAL